MSAAREKQPANAPLKLDAIYKPFLRRFRFYFRDKFDEGHKKRDYSDWTTEELI